MLRFQGLLSFLRRRESCGAFWIPACAGILRSILDSRLRGNDGNRDFPGVKKHFESQATKVARATTIDVTALENAVVLNRDAQLDSAIFLVECRRKPLAQIV